MSDMSDERLIPYLLQRYLDDQLTAEELETFAGLLREHPDDEGWALRLQELGLLQERDLAYEEARWKPVLEEILRHRKEGREEGEEDRDADAAFGGGSIVRRMPVYGVRRVRWVAAAAVILLLAGGLYWYRQQARAVSSAQEQMADRFPALKPGGNKAVLTLANGQHIVLDSAADGVLASEGSSRVQKLKNGELAYETTKTSPAVMLYNTLTTPRGGQYQLQLPDGSRVWLDAASSLTYPTAFSGAVRKVKLTGQAYFEVVHHAENPFIVEVNGTEVKDIGTAFNINAYDDEPVARITLVTGSVAVERGGARAMLSPGEQARIAENKLSVASGVDVDEVVAWKNGQFQFDNAGVGEVMRQVARWYNVEISYEGDVLNKHFSGGVPRGANASELIHVLELTKSVRIRMEGNKIIVKPYTDER